MTRTTAPSLAHSSLQVEPLGGPDPLAPLSPSARPGNPTEFSQSDRRGPRARTLAPGRAKYFNSSHSVAIPQRPVSCPSTLVLDVGLLWPKPTRIPVFRIGNMPSSTERKSRGLDLVARDKPSDNLMLKSGASWLQPSLPGARIRAEKGAGTLDGSGRRRYDQ